MKIIAHRGNSAHWPENTLAAFRSARETGADGIELDVRLTRDRQVVVFHDADGQRLCNEPRRLRDIQYTDLQSWRVRRYGDIQSIDARERRGEPVPMLVDVFAEVPSSQTIYVELKEGGELIDCLSLIRRDGERKDCLSLYRRDGVVLLAFDPEVARAAKRLSVPVWLNVEAERVGDIDAVIDIVRGHSLDGVSLGYSDRLDRDCVARVHAAGLPLAVWTVNEVAVARRLRDWGVDVLMTDDPAGIIAGLDLRATRDGDRTIQ